MGRPDPKTQGDHRGVFYLPALLIARSAAMSSSDPVHERAISARCGGAITRSEAKGRSSVTRARLAVIDVDMAAAVLGPEPLFFLTDTGFSHVDMAEAGVGSWATLD